MKNNLNWDYFKISDLFYVCQSKGDNQAKDLEEGDIPLISAGKTKNGIVKYILNGDEKSEKFKGGCITADMFGKCFYQPDDFFAVSHGRVNILIAKNFNLTKNLGLYLITILEKEFELKYSYNRMLSQEKLNNTYICLPVSSEGNPNWEEMEEQIISLEQNAKNQLNQIIEVSQNDKSTIENLLYNVEIEEFNKWAVNFQSKSKLSLNVSLWKPFDIADLFEVETGGDILPQEEEEGEIPVIGLGFGSNGYCMKIKENLKHPLYDKGKITVSGWAGGLKAYYQTNNFYVKGRLKICTPKFIMSPYIAWFICTIINMQDYKFSYGRKASGDKFLYLKISLPIKMENGNPVIDNNKKYSEFGYIPDFEFMENYIKELPYSIQL